MMANNRIIKVSPSSLNLYLECQKCFWLQLSQGIRRPEPPTSSLPSGIDLALKAYFDHWRGNGGIPPLLKDKIPGRLHSDQAQIARFRSRSFEWLDEKSGASFTGILDDALELSDGSVVPLDNKTRGFPPLEPHSAHVFQMSAYTLLLQKNNFKTKNLAYLIYWFFDHKNMDLEKPLNFNITVEEVKTDPVFAEKTFREAVAVVKGPAPKPNMDCQFCNYRDATRNY